MGKTLFQVVSVLLVSYACAPSAGIRPPGSRESGDQLITEVKADWDPDVTIPSKLDNDAKIGDSYPVGGLDAYTAKLKKKHWYTRKKHNWIAVIHATEPYPRMKLSQGDNYVFQVDQPTDAAHAFVVVPGDKSQPYYLVLSSADLAHGNPGKPLIVRRQVPSTSKIEQFVIGGCIECPPLGHCSTTDVGDPYQ